jgi:putative ABC transport system substrate-binding protein
MRGIFDGLRELGFVEGKNLEVRRAHAQGEIVNIPAILQNFDGSDVDVILPMSTPVISGACGLVKRKPWCSPTAPIPWPRARASRSPTISRM